MPPVRPSFRPSVQILVTTITQEGSHIFFSNSYQACIYKRSRTSSDSGDLHLKVKVISSENRVTAITQEGSHVGFSNLYQACIYKRSRTILDSGDLDFKVKVTGHFF